MPSEFVCMVPLMEIVHWLVLASYQESLPGESILPNTRGQSDVIFLCILKRRSKGTACQSSAKMNKRKFFVLFACDTLKVFKN